MHCTVAALVGWLELMWARGPGSLRWQAVENLDYSLICAFKVGRDHLLHLSAPPTWRGF